MPVAFSNAATSELVSCGVLAVVEGDRGVPGASAAAAGERSAAGDERDQRAGAQQAASASARHAAGPELRQRVDRDRPGDDDADDVPGVGDVDVERTGRDGHSIAVAEPQLHEAVRPVVVVSDHVGGHAISAPRSVAGRAHEADLLGSDHHLHLAGDGGARRAEASEHALDDPGTGGSREDDGVADEPRDVEIDRRAVEDGRSCRLREPARAEHGDLVPHRQRLGLVVGDEHGGRALCGQRARDRLARLGPEVRVEAGERLVEQHDPRLRRERLARPTRRCSPPESSWGRLAA